MTGRLEYAVQHGATWLADMPDHFPHQIRSLDRSELTAVHTVLMSPDNEYLSLTRLQCSDSLDHHPEIRMAEGDHIVFFETIQKEGDFGD